MVTHPVINPVQQGLTSVNRREPVFSFGDSLAYWVLNQFAWRFSFLQGILHLCFSVFLLKLIIDNIYKSYR